MIILDDKLDRDNQEIANLPTLLLVILLQLTENLKNQLKMKLL